MYQSVGRALDDDERELLETQWLRLKRGFERLVQLVESGCKTGLSDIPNHMELYTIVYNLCTSPKGCDDHVTHLAVQALLYERYGELLTSYLNQRTIDIEGKDPDMFLREVVNKWQKHQVVSRWLGKYFSYIDRFYTVNNDKDNLNEYSLKLFFKHVYTPIKVPMRDAIFERIQRERSGETIDRSILKESIELYLNLKGDTNEPMHIYTYDFEHPFIERTGEYYKREASRWVADDSATEYLKKAEKRLLEEAQRASAYLPRESDLIKEVENRLLAEQQQTLLEMENSGFVALLRDRRLEDIERAYRLFSRIPKGLNLMAQLMREYVTSEGKQLVAKHSSSPDLCFKAYTQDLLDLHKKYRSILHLQFNDNQVFQKAIKDSFEIFVNDQVQCIAKNAPPGSPPHKVFSSDLIASYCDMVMRNSRETDLEDTLEHVVQLFGYISDKDLFQEFYRKQLSKRLLMSTVNDEAERSLISKLKMRQGAPYTSRLEKMITDKNVSQGLQADFKEYLDAKGIRLGFDYTMQVLTTVSWPTFHIHPLNVPPPVQQAMSHFTDFYAERTKCRKLRWVHSLATVTIEALYGKEGKAKETSKYTLSMTAFQACVLLLFNSQDGEEAKTLTGEDIVAELGLPWDETKKALQSLAMGKYKLLLKAGAAGAKPTRVVEQEDRFSVNDAFSDRSRKLKVPTVVAKVNVKLSQQVKENVEEDRKHAIEACIVRIMKSRKQMEHPVLVSECIAQLASHFKPDPRNIKKRIEDLISREYLERDSEKHSLYRYVA